MRKSLLLMIGVLIITGIVLFIGWEDVYRVISRMRFHQLLLMTLLQLGTLFLTAFIWFYLIKQKSRQVSLLDVFCINLAGTFVESVTPSVKIGGETLKMYLMKKKTTLGYSDLTAIAVMSKFFSLLPFLFISGLTLFIAFFILDLPGFVYLAFLGLIIFFSLFLVFFNFQGLKLDAFFGHLFKGKFNTEGHQTMTKLVQKAEKVYSFLVDASNKSKHTITEPHQRLLLFIAAFIVWAFYPIKVYMVASMLGYQLSPVIVVIGIYTAYLVSMVPLLPGGLATFEGTLALIIAYQGLSLTEAFSIALMTRVITFWIPLVLSAIVTLYLIKKSDIETSSKSGAFDLG